MLHDISSDIDNIHPHNVEFLKTTRLQSAYRARVELIYKTQNNDWQEEESLNNITQSVEIALEEEEEENSDLLLP